MQVLLLQLLLLQLLLATAVAKAAAATIYTCATVCMLACIQHADAVPI
jgi:hypothetical protein